MLIVRKLLDITVAIAGVVILLNHRRFAEVLIERRRNVALNRMMGFTYGPGALRAQEIVLVIGGAGFLIGSIADFLGWPR